MNFIFLYSDALWLLIALVIARKDQRLVTLGFIGAGMILMRLQIELIESTGFIDGIAGLLHLTLFQRGLITYSAFYAFYLIMLQFSPTTKGSLLLAGALSLFFIAFCVSSVVMVL